MKFKPYLLAAAALALNPFSATAPAYAADNGWVDDKTGLPFGDYSSSCTNIQWSEVTKVLTATCQDAGRQITSSVTVPVARAPTNNDTILNCGGRLQVVGNGECDLPPPPPPLPSPPLSPIGTYLSSCTNVKWDDGKKILSASCPIDPSQNSFATSVLNVPSTFFLDIANCNGVLTILRSKTPTCPVANTTPTTGRD